ncbi:uncharacterized protein LOC128506964 [Clarias gariepinus]|uniref:uncharacterized protein LOC128506964 n=1 Tax=Clarias gariepinus TaxID=13013 RepID=UPI00234E3386|nr:uncharacterized protein LOC128506964 [Clarias gariepinus]
MKTLLIIIIIITFYLISGPVHCSDVIGYPGGRLIIYYKHSVNFRSPVYFCRRKTQTECKDLIRAQGEQLHTGVHQDRFTLFTSEGFITLIFRNLSLQDTGVYQGGETGVWSQNFNLKVIRDPCCSQRKTVRGYSGRTVRISCSYPVEFKTYMKFFYKLNRLSETPLILTRVSEQHKDGRFSISDDTRNKEFSVNISDVGEDDGGVYSCAVSNEETEVIYHSLFTGIQLQVTEVTDDLTKNPGGISETPETGFLFIIIIIIITVCVCVIMLTLGTSLFTYMLRKYKTQDSALTSQRTEANNMIADYENNQPQVQNIRMHLVYQSQNSNSNASDSVYQSLDCNTNQSDSVYQSLDCNTNQSDSVYQSLDCNTNQSDSVYQSLDCNTNQSDSVYQSLDCNTNQSDSVYQSLDCNTNQSDSVYQSLDCNTNQSDSVYQSLDCNTNQSDSVYQTLNNKLINHIQSTRIWTSKPNN